MNQDIRICFVGDSFVNGTGDAMALGWAGRLCVEANTYGSQVTCYNLGIRRNTSRDILARWELECRLRLPESCDGRVVISCGVNDTVLENGAIRVSFTESCNNVRDILGAAKNYKVLMVGPPPVNDDDQDQRINALSSAYAAIAAELEVPFIDLFSALALDESYSAEISGNDSFHPGSEGYIKMANIIASSGSWWFKRP